VLTSQTAKNSWLFATYPDCPPPTQSPTSLSQAKKLPLGWTTVTVALSTDVPSRAVIVTVASVVTGALDNANETVVAPVVTAIEAGTEMAELLADRTIVVEDGAGAFSDTTPRAVAPPASERGSIARSVIAMAAVPGPIGESYQCGWPPQAAARHVMIASGRQYERRTLEPADLIL